MKTEFTVLSPLSLDEAQQINDYCKGKDITVLCSKDCYIITFIGQRKYKYPKKNICKSIINKIDYTIKNFI